MSSRSVKKIRQSEIKNWVVLLNKLELNRVRVLALIFMCFVAFELLIERFLLSAVWAVLLRLSLILLFFLLWLFFCRRGVASILASSEGLYFLISRRFNRRSDKYFFIAWEDVVCIKCIEEVSLEVKTRIPLFGRGKRFPSVPDEYQCIHLDGAYFRPPGLLDETASIRVLNFCAGKWLYLDSVFPVSVVR